jgi:hypothetical protein
MISSRLMSNFIVAEGGLPQTIGSALVRPYQEGHRKRVGIGGRSWKSRKPKVSGSPPPFQMLTTVETIIQWAAASIWFPFS